MPDLKLIKNPGYVYDLMFLFFCKYNSDLLPEIFEATEEDMEYFVEVTKGFEPISEDLYIFFRCPPTKRCFFATYYFHNYSSLFMTDYDLAFIQKEINDHDAFIKNVIKHYFDDLDDKQVEECMKSRKYLFDFIKRSDYDDKLKSKLYEFFVDPDLYIHTLQYELMAKDVQLSSYYERNYSKILDVYNELNYDLLQERFSILEHVKEHNIESYNIALSFCILNKKLLQFRYYPAPLYIIGVDYRSALDVVKKKRIDFVPERFGSALSDANRVKMLDVILQKGWCTCKELEVALGIPASTAYHHVSTLERCGVVEARISKKSMLYGINRRYFTTVIDYFKKFSESFENKQ